MTGGFVWTPREVDRVESNVARFLKKHGIASYDELVRRSVDEPEWFWDAVVADLPIDFFQRYQQTLDTSLGIPWAKWFVGGTINLAHNCLDRHVLRPESRDRAALIWEGENGDERTWTYGELFAETNRVAHAMIRLGIQQGDRIGLFLPMLPEAVAAFLACAKIGAIAVPMFSGYGAEAVASRLIDGEAKLLITSQSSRRKGKVIPMLSVAEEAVEQSPSVRHVIVIDRARGHRFLSPVETCGGTK